MSALGVGLWILISSTSTITDSRPPLSDEELQLLQSIEAEQIDVEEAEKPEGTQIEDESYESLGRRAVQDWRSWAATLTENLAASDLAVRWTRDEPGHLKPVVKGQATHRSLTTLDGLPIRTMFDGVNELGAAVLFDPQTVSGPQLTDSRLQLRRGGAHLVASSKTGIESWLTSGSYLRDYGAGIGLSLIHI